MEHIENVMHRAKVLLQRHSKVFQYITTCFRKFLKRIITYLCFSKFNEISISHSNIQKHVSYKIDLNSIYIYICCIQAVRKIFDTLWPLKGIFKTL